MQHITLNTGNIATCGDRLFALDRLEVGALLEPYDRYSVTAIFGEEDWCYFDLALDGEHITSNLAARSNGEGWEQMLSLYLQIYQKLPPVSANPPRSPYLVTVVLPSVKIFESNLAAQVEQAIALNALD